MRHSRRFWSTVPLIAIAIGTALALPCDDAFASLERTGHAVAPEALLEAAPTMPNGLPLVERPMLGCRIRAWRVDRSSRAVIRVLVAGGLSGSRVRWRRNPKGSLVLESQTLYDPLIWARVTVLNHHGWKDRSCLVRVEEPRDGQAVWNRLAARVRRGAMR